MIVNVNNVVQFRLTAYGREVYQAYVAQLTVKSLQEIMLAKLAEPMMRMALWEFANIFGQANMMGRPPVTELHELEVCL